MKLPCQSSLCTACGACIQACPFQALEWHLESSGEPRPVLDEGKCRHCGRCVQVCPEVTGFAGRYPLAGYACWLRDMSDAAECSSGGAARALGQSVLERGGKVFGCAFREGKCHHVHVDTLDGLRRLSGSKYVWSDVGGTFAEVRELLRANESGPVLFFGTPCQVSGLRNFLGELAQSERFYAVDLICHGVPSPYVLNEFIRETEGDLPESLSCRDRHGLALHGRLMNGREFHYTGGFGCNVYLQAYIHGLTYRERCYSCPYAQALRMGDLTLGDFWGIDRRFLPAEAGVLLNVMLVNTAQGRRLLETARGKLVCHTVPVSAVLDGKTNLRQPQSRPPERDVFLRKIPSVGVAGAFHIALRRQRFHLWRSGFLHGVKKLLTGIIRRRSCGKQAVSAGTEAKKTRAGLRILLGGVPLGCDNIGDEAIVACVVKLLRSVLPECELTVCTRKPEETASLLKVRTVPLYGFGPNPDWKGFEAEVHRQDAYLWFGATGLSDYPETALRLLEMARRNGVKTLVWGVGMSAELNPAFYRAGGRRRGLLRFLTCLSLGFIDWVALYEHWLVSRTRKHVGRELQKCRLVMLRDRDSQVEMRRCGFTEALVGADTAILLESSATSPLPPSENVRIGFCISAQRAVKSLDGIVELWNNILDDNKMNIILMPMNPVTDKKLMLELSKRVKCPERIECLETASPSAVQACVAQCRAVVSSRLHLLIFAANAGVPFIGIDRGGKITTWMHLFGREPVGSVENCDFAEIRRQLAEVLSTPPAVERERIQRVVAQMRSRLGECAKAMRGLFFQEQPQDEEGVAEDIPFK
ncbi:MAG: polysaccharide pyruvyl transferase family protein [Victivallales bacterium]|nr:polysaccharide pyruvyl transferase family protein [Victivallales bacterium]